MRKLIRALAGCALLAIASAHAQAQTMYRCGNVFQDRPCEKGVSEQRVIPGGGRAGTAGAPTAATASSPFAAECSRRGEHAQRITWQREGGATLERQINDAHGNQEMVNLVQNVYARRGSAPEIRAAVEADCVSEKERAAAAAEAIRTLQQQNPSAQSTVQTSAPATGSQSQRQAQAQPAAVTAGPDPMCGSYRTRRENAESRLRQGGSASAMEGAQRERREAERLMNEARC